MATESDAAKDRVIEERNALIDKIGKINPFLVSPACKALSELSFKLLKLQKHTMEVYADILSLRLQHWGD